MIMIAGKIQARQLGRIGGFFGLGTLLGLSILVSIARVVWHSKFYPGVSVGGVEIGGMSREQALIRVDERIEQYRLVAEFNGLNWEVPKDVIVYDVGETINLAYRYGRRLKLSDYLLLLVNKQTNYPLKVAVGSGAEAWLAEIASVVEIGPKLPSVEVIKNSVVVTQGSDGVIVDRAEWEKLLLEKAANLRDGSIMIPVKNAKMQLGEEKLAKLKERGETILQKSLQLELDDERANLGAGEMVTWLYTGQEEKIIEVGMIQEYVRGLSESWDRPPQDARFEFVDGRVKEFAPGRDGVKIEVGQTTELILTAMTRLVTTEEAKQEKVTVVAKRTPPAVTTDKVNELGIRERIGRGESYYAHSIPNRIYNVGLASLRLNSVLIPPGEEFSFNKYVGEVSGATGYRAAYVISAGRTVLGDGGGVCQVSTTMFRAAMAAGLPITERWGHAYRVSYYELNSKPGVDATVYAPSKDIKFKNDTPGHILIQTINDPKNLHLIIEIYGTSDGRVATISEPKVWGVSPPPPSIYQDDPTLPAGVVKQVDWAAWGAKASFEYRVVRNGETILEKTFTTAYRPWANVYLRGTATQ